MAIELKFSKPDNQSAWGFRLVGGADFNEPLVVVKVNDNSFAENAGLLVGDVIVRINNSPTAGLSHADAHDIIHNSGNEVILAVRRDLISEKPVQIEEVQNSEVETIFKNSIAEQLTVESKDQTVGSSPKSPENLAGQEQLFFNGSRRVSDKSKQWSTFLVKPKNQKPISKQVIEERKILGEPYRVKIVKQPRRDPKDVLNHKKTVQFEPNVTEVEFSSQTSVTDSIDSIDSIEFTNKQEMEIKTFVEHTEETVVEEKQEEEEIEEDEIEVDSMRKGSLDSEIGMKEELAMNKPKTKLNLKPIDIHIDPVICESSLSLEDQLAAVQKQLLALSQLPSAIQVTLEAVTQQLNKIVLEKSVTIEENGYYENGFNENGRENGYEDEDVDVVAEEEEMPDDNQSVSENAEADITENEEAVNFEDLDEEENFIEHTENSLEENKLGEEADNAALDPYFGLTEEEIEAKIKEEQLLAKKQKEEEERRKMDWTQRPIILPGGRKWSDPEDATPKPRCSKMSEEKICKAIEDYSEVIVGKTKGINFLKYQPPPKNLDYLQKSEVYRLIHGMEPPVKGVGARAEKILSEKDYYGVKGAP